MERLPIELLSRILEEASDSVGSVVALSTVCVDWRHVVYRVPWKFHGYLPVSLLETFPNLLAPEAFFLTTLPPFHDSLDIEDEKTETGAILGWVRRRKARKVRVHLVRAMHDQSRVFRLFDLLTQDSIVTQESAHERSMDDVIVRGRDGWLYGFRYERWWSCSEGSGLLVVDSPYVGDTYVTGIIERLAPVYLILQGQQRRRDWVRPLPPCVKILGIHEVPHVHEILDIVRDSKVQELRVLSSNSLDILHLDSTTDEEYGVMGSLRIIDDIIPSSEPLPNILRIRGGVHQDDAMRALALFPKIGAIEIAYDCHPSSQNQGSRNVVSSRISQDPRLRVFAPSMTLRLFWSRASQEIYEGIVKYLNLREVVLMTQIFDIRSRMSNAYVPSIPASMLTNLPDSVVYDIITVATPKELGLLFTRSWPGTSDVHVLGGDAMITLLLATLKEELTRPFSRLPSLFTILFQFEPRASIHYNQMIRSLILHLPSRFRSLALEFKELPIKVPIPTNLGLEFTDTIIPTCNFYEDEGQQGE